jgi:hypothetical protein
VARFRRCTGFIAMAMLGPMVVVAESPATDLIDALGRAGAFPIVEATWADAPAAPASPARSPSAWTCAADR